MRITDECIDQAWRELSEALAAGGQSVAGARLEAFAAAQPALADFLGEAFEGQGAEAADLGYFVALVIYHGFRRSIRQDLEEVPAGRVLREYAATRAWLETLADADPILLEKRLREEKQYREPAAVRFVCDAVFDAGEDGVELGPREQERLFLALKVVVDCLSEN